MTLVTINQSNPNFKIHGLLRENLDLMKRANKRDWDFKLIISGDGMTRTGKTTIAAQIAKYLDNRATEGNWVYGGNKLIDTAKSLPKGSAIIYDEAREGLDSKKARSKYSQLIVDYFNECGYLNHFMIIILPDFFDLNKSVALNLSIALINVYVTGEFYRGNFDFYSRKAKKNLYVRGLLFRNYSHKLQRPSFRGNFNKYMPFDPQKLEDMKAKAIERKKEQHYKRRDIILLKLAGRLINNQILKVKELHKLMHDEISSEMTIYNWLKKFKQLP